MKTQKPRHGKPRTKACTSLEEAIRKAVQREADRFDCSKSFVIATAFAYTFGIKTEDYRSTK